MNPFEMVVLIVAIVMVGSVLRTRAQARYRIHDNGGSADPAETRRLQDEVKQLKERIHVLERIATEKEHSLSREIDELRDR